MLSTRKIAAAAFMLVVAGTHVEAQGGGGGGRGGMGGNPEMQARQRALLFDGITLDAAQTVKIDSIQAATRTKQQEMRQAGMAGGDRQAMMAHMQEMRSAERKAIRELLTKEQQEQFDKNVAKMPAMGRPPRGR